MHFLKGILVAIFLVVISGKVNASDVITDFSKNTIHSNVKISPDGKFLSVVVFIDEKRALGIIERSSMKMINAIRFPGRAEVGNYYWVNNERLVIMLAESQSWEREPKFYGELLAVNWDGSKSSMIYGYRAGEMQTGTNIKKREAVRGWPTIISILPDNKKQILISSTPWNDNADRVAELLLLDVYNGKLRKVGSAPVPNASILTDEEGGFKLAMGKDNQNETVVYRYNAKSKDWTAIPKSQFGNDFFAIGLNSSGESVYVLDDFQQDKMGLFELKLEDFSYKEIFTDTKVDISDYEKTKDSNKVFAVKLEDGRPTYALLTDQYLEAKIFKDLLSTFAGDALTITSKSDDEQFWVVKVYSDVNPGEFYLYDRKENGIHKLFDAMPHLAKRTLVTTEPVMFKSFDDMEIHGYFTKGKGSDTAKPLVVNVHGGPHGVRDRWGFDSEVQLLADAGYSVLQVNYRGSGGYGNQYLVSGYRQWGDAIQRDIIAGTEWAINTGKAQAGNICIIGGSFGAYSALQSATLAPDLYNCAVGVAGVYDLSIMKSKGDIYERYTGMAFLSQVLGDDETLLKAFSPVNHVNKLKIPVLIAHGKKDERAPLIHAEKLRDAMDIAGTQYQWLQFDDETHGFYSPENRQLYYGELLAFLQQHLKK